MKKIDLLIILVVYKKRFNDISALNFIKNFQEKGDLELQLLIYDNSPEAINSAEELPCGISYVHNKNNPGLATAYNYALDVATNYNCEWLLLLDHDTELIMDYFIKVFALFKQSILTSDIVAIMPIVKAQQVTIAPVKREFIRYHVALNKTGKLTGNISGINSGTIVRISFVKQLGGFNLNFPLDYLDHCFFNEIRKAGKYVYVLDTTIHQNLSVLNFHENINPVRYNSILRAQVLFYRDKSLLFSMRLKLILLKKLIKHLLYTKNKQYALLTLKHLIESFK